MPVYLCRHIVNQVVAKWSVVNLRKTFITLVIVLWAFACDATPIKLGYPEFSPYTFTKDNQPTGIAIEWMKTISKRLGKQVEFVPVGNYGNAVYKLKINKIDGLLLATKNAERDDIALFSEPLTVNNWNWFYLKQHTDVTNKNITVATHINANTHKWLLKNNYTSIYATADVRAMIRQLEHQRVDAIFLAEKVFKLAVPSSYPFPYYSTTQRSMPFGIYMNKNYLSQQPEFMEKLNKQIIRLKNEIHLPKSGF